MIDIMVDEGVCAAFSSAMIEKTVATSCKLAGYASDVSLCVRFADDDTVKQLNAAWRKRDKVTDVLSFPMQEAASIDTSQPLGDMILAAPFVRDEAERLGVPEDAHIYHLVAHSTLHLLGYDHMQDDEAEIMQRLENDIMHALGLHKPYPEWN